MKVKLHILFLNSWYPSKVLPANGDFIQRHAEAIALEHQVTAIHVISDKSIKKNLVIDDTTINRVRTIIAYHKFSKNPLIKISRFFKSYLQLLNRIEYFDVVHLNRIYPVGLIALYLKWFKKKRYIVSEHWHGYHKPFCNNISFAERLFSKQIVKSASCICPVTDQLGTAMRNFGLTNNNYIKVSNVIDTDLFKPIDKVQNTFKIIHISSMDKVKNVPEILKAIGKLQSTNVDFKFYLIGNNAVDFSSLAKQLKISPTRISFINQLSHQNLVSYLQQADVLVLFSTIENAPCVILEAFACGVSVISTNVGGISEHFPKDFGTLIPMHDTNALLEALIQNHNTKKKISKEAMHTYVNQNFSKMTVAKQFTKVYLSVLKK